MKKGVIMWAALFALPGTAFGAWGAWVNPWFLDAPLSFLAAALLFPALVGAGVGALMRRGFARVGPVLAALELAVVIAAMARPRPDPVSPKLIVFGIDGATWPIIDQLRTPTFDRLQEEGARAVLRSHQPMFSPLVWTTMSTGKRPEQHGIHGFRTRADLTRAARFWDVAEARGMRAGIYKWLVTWPPILGDAGGFMVPAWLAPKPDTIPADLSWVKELELSRRLKRKKIAQVRPTWRLVLSGIPTGLRWSTLLRAADWTVRNRLARPGTAEREWRLQLLRVWMDRDIFIEQLHRYEPELATFTTYATDALGHTHWDLMMRCGSVRGEQPEPADCPPWSDALPDAYRQADTVLGEILANVTPNTPVIVVSDHGFRGMKKSDLARHFAPLTERLRTRLQAEVGPVDVARVGHKVTVTLLGENPEAERQKLVDWLGRFIDAATGKPFYVWEPVPDDPGAVGLTLADERITADRLAHDTVGGDPLKDYVKRTEAYSGEHDIAGVLMARGPRVPAGARLPDADLLDVAPTILCMLGLPPAQDQPGRALFCPPGTERVATYDSLAPSARVGSRGPATDEDVNMERLKALGYVGGDDE